MLQCTFVHCEKDPVNSKLLTIRWRGFHLLHGCLFSSWWALMYCPSQSRHNVQNLNLYVQRKEEVWIHYYVFISSSTEWHHLIIIILSSLKGNIVVIKLLMRILNLVDCAVCLITDWSRSHRSFSNKQLVLCSTLYYIPYTVCCVGYTIDGFALTEKI